MTDSCIDIEESASNGFGSGRNCFVRARTDPEIVVRARTDPEIGLKTDVGRALSASHPERLGSFGYAARLGQPIARRLASPNLEHGLKWRGSVAAPGFGRRTSRR